jgi:hypothetical protein
MPGGSQARSELKMMSCDNNVYVSTSNSEGETDLHVILKNLKLSVHEGEYVFCCLPDLLTVDIDMKEVKSMIREKEGVSVVVAQSYADALQLRYDFVASWITIDVHSSLSAVGLTAAISKALTHHSISCNVVAGFYHDHLFVSRTDCDRAVSILHSLTLS